jgi:hypothetical protein
MRMLAVLALALCCHGGSASDYRSMLSTHLLKAGCGSAQIAESNRCISAAFGTITGSDTCENFGVFSPCWPPCYCDSPKGFRQLVEEKTAVHVASALRRREACAARGARETRRPGVNFVWNLLVSTTMSLLFVWIADTWENMKQDTVRACSAPGSS